jgi:Glycosyl transferase family 2
MVALHHPAQPPYEACTNVTRAGPGLASPLTISVVIPTYQRREHVKRAVLSALGQSRPPTQVIVVDDGSTDGTRDALAEFGDRLQYFCQDNEGPSSARNLGVRAARGKIIAFLDSDDCWLPGHLATIVEAFTQNKEAVLASTCPGLRFGAPLSSRTPTLVAPLPRLLIGNFVGYPSCTAVRRDALIAAGGFDEGLEPSEGYALWLRLGTAGPYALVRRRTVIRGRFDDSLSSRGVREGAFLNAREQIGKKVIANLGRQSPELDRAARSYGSFLAALRALDQGDTEAASIALANACRLMPERSQEPWLIGGWLGLIPRSSAPEGRLTAQIWAAESWPDRKSDTAAGLRIHASILALRSGRPRLAVRLLRRSAVKATLRYSIRLARGALAVKFLSAE